MRRDKLLGNLLKGREFGVDEYAEAFKRMMAKNRLHENHFRMLQIHFSNRGRTIAVPDLAEKVGYQGYHGVNLQYGYIGRWLSEDRGYFPKKPNGEHVWTLGIAWGKRKDRKSMWEWTMYENFATALLAIGVVR